MQYFDYRFLGIAIAQAQELNSASYKNRPNLGNGGVLVMNDVDDHKNLHIAYLENVLASIDFVPREALGKMYFKNEDECDLGKWMNENCERFRRFKSNASLSERHKEFHDVLSLAVQSQVQGATKEVVDGLIKEARRLCFSISELIDMLSHYVDQEKGRGNV